MTDYLYRYAKEKGILLGICRAEIIEICTDDKTPFVSKDIGRRTNPDKILQGARSIIAVGVKYDEQNAFNELISDGHGSYCRISKMASADYHIRLKALLNDTADYMKNVVKQDFKYRILVDSGTLIEREYAKRAGLGFIGKNRMLISREIGSFFNIGLMLTDLDLEPSVDRQADMAVNDDCSSECGKCVKCITACPAALSGSEYDVEKCISYLTQKKGDFDNETKRLLNGYIYGCDICQNACPFNKDKSEIILDADKLAGMTEDQFCDAFGSTSMSWIGYDLFRRNVDYSLTRNLLK